MKVTHIMKKRTWSLKFHAKIIRNEVVSIIRHSGHNKFVIIRESSSKRKTQCEPYRSER